MPGQRYTSSRRRNAGEGTGGGRAVPLTGGVRARKSNTTVGPLAYTGQDAVTCPECGVGLKPTEDLRNQGVIRRHARYGYAPSPSKGRPLCRGALIASPSKLKRSGEALDSWTEDEARARRLVTRGMIARRYGMGPQALARFIRDQPGFPRPVASLADAPTRYLYEGDAVVRFMTLHQPQEGGD